MILYGPPGAGKDTITRELTVINARYVHFQRMKAGGGNIAGYRLASDADITALRERGELLYSNRRYDATYAVDRTGLERIVNVGRVPVIHLGQIAGIVAVTDGYPISWIVACLWCDRDEARRRLTARLDERIDERLSAWDATAVDIRAADPSLFTVGLNTRLVDAKTSAQVIDSIWSSVAKDVRP